VKLVANAAASAKTLIAAVMLVAGIALVLIVGRRPKVRRGAETSPRSGRD
jgi:hypothetical protein